MAFDPVTLLTMSAVILGALGLLMLSLSRADGPHDGRRLTPCGDADRSARLRGDPGRTCALLRWSGVAFLCLGAGFALVLCAPGDIHATSRVLGNALLMLPYGVLWGAARRFDGRETPGEAVAAGVLAWLLPATLLDPSQGARMALTSTIVAAYSFATAFEHRRGRDGLAAQRHAAWIFAAHGAFFALRAVLGPTFGLAPWGPNIASFWGALLGLETVTMAVTVGLASIGMSRERTARDHRREALEDPLTGIGNRRALQRSGAALLEACRSAGRPAALLLMDLDRFKRINDRHGHPAGDRLLVAFARLAHDYLPPVSLVCRIGGEEFAALIPGADLARGRAVADELRTLFAHAVLDDPSGPLRTTVSVGVAEASCGEGADGPAGVAGLLARADLCLYAAKHAGRDRVVAEGEGEVRRTAA